MTTDDRPRRRALLEAWGKLIARDASGPNFDFSSHNRTIVTQRQVAAFLQDPTEDQFEALWRIDVLADAVMGGPQSVLKRHTSLDDVADTVQAIADASAYNPEWESKFLTPTVVWELYGRLHPEREPILNSTCAEGLSVLGFARPKSFAEAQEEWAAFGDVYESVVGHATTGTDHEVPLNHEMSEFLWFTVATPATEINALLQDVSDGYLPLTGWQDEVPLKQDVHLSGHEQHIAGYIEAEEQGGFTEGGPGDLWNHGYWEDWKDAYLDHIETVVVPRYDLTNLSNTDVAPLLADLTEQTTLSTPVPSYLLGGRSGGILWNEFRKYSESNPDEGSEILSYLFDEEVDLTLRLDRFAKFYRSMETTGGPLMSLATMLLTFVYPTEYVCYKYSLMHDFFAAFADYDVRQGYNPDQYWKLNLACHQLLMELQRGLTNKEPTLLDVYTLLYVWQRNYHNT